MFGEKIEGSNPSCSTKKSDIFMSLFFCIGETFISTKLLERQEAHA